MDIQRQPLVIPTLGDLQSLTSDPAYVLPDQLYSPSFATHLFLRRWTAIDLESSRHFSCPNFLSSSPRDLNPVITLRLRVLWDGHSCAIITLMANPFYLSLFVPKDEPTLRWLYLLQGDKQRKWRHWNASVPVSTNFHPIEQTVFTPYRCYHWGVECPTTLPKSRTPTLNPVNSCNFR